MRFLKDKLMYKPPGSVAVPGYGYFHTDLPLEKLSLPVIDCIYRKRYIKCVFCRSNAMFAAVVAQMIGELLHD